MHMLNSAGFGLVLRWGHQSSFSFQENWVRRDWGTKQVWLLVWTSCGGSIMIKCTVTDLLDCMLLLVGGNLLEDDLYWQHSHFNSLSQSVVQQVQKHCVTFKELEKLGTSRRRLCFPSIKLAVIMDSFLPFYLPLAAARLAGEQPALPSIWSAVRRYKPVFFTERPHFFSKCNSHSFISVHLRILLVLF